MSTSSQNSIEQRVQFAVGRALGITVSDAASLRMGSTPGWDSMGHMLVVTELEREFQTSFPIYQLPQLVDIPSIIRAVQECQPR